MSTPFQAYLSSGDESHLQRLTREDICRAINKHSPRVDISPTAPKPTIVCAAILLLYAENEKKQKEAAQARGNFYLYTSLILAIALLLCLAWPFYYEHFFLYSQARHHHQRELGHETLYNDAVYKAAIEDARQQDVTMHYKTLTAIGSGKELDNVSSLTKALVSSIIESQIN